jgi:hypothetical protein
MKTPVEYREVNNSNRSVVTVLKTVKGNNGREYTLSHHTAGYEPVRYLASDHRGSLAPYSVLRGLF